MPVSRMGEVSAQMQDPTPLHLALLSETIAAYFSSKKHFKALQVSLTVGDTMTVNLIIFKV